MAQLPGSYCKIFPPIGIARLGNSPSEFFVGPEVPSVVPEVSGTYKDKQGRIKRQGARFHLYAFCPDGSVEELTADHPEVQSIEWTVALANRKADWHIFDGARNVAKIIGGEDLPRRNSGVPPQDRALLAITPDPVTVAGRNTAPVAMEGSFSVGHGQRHEVHLGDARTDAEGRLIVLGGFGRSESVLASNPLTHYANNDGWFDDTSDGPVTAVVRLKDGTSLPLRGRSWVVCAPPHFSPWTRNVVTLHHVMTEAAMRHELAWDERELGPRPSDEVSFARDIYPALTAMSEFQWVSRRSQRGHAPGKRGAFPDEETLQLLASAAEAAKPNSPHKRFFARLRHPVATPPYDDDQPEQRWPVVSSESIIARQQATLYYMPPLAGDEGDVEHEVAETWLTLTPMQYAKFARWKDGHFAEDRGRNAAPASLQDIPVAQQPAALTFAALEFTQGGAFYPGIELTSVVRHREFYSEAFRVSDAKVAGDLTKWMALPWQADFYECRDHWWPAVRPDDVIPVGNYERIIEEFEQEVSTGVLADVLIARLPWTRGVGIEVVNRPGFPDLMEGQTPLEYKAAFERLWRRYVRDFVGRYVPQILENELDDVYRARVLEFLDKTILSKPAFEVPVRPGGASDEDYVRLVLVAIRQYITDNAPIRAPSPGESTAAYRNALIDSFSRNEIVNGVLDVVWRASYAHQGKNEMVRKWHRLGFVTPRTAANQTVWVETDRGRFDLIEARQHFYHLMNIESYPEYLPTARELGHEYFRRARAEVEPVLQSIGFERYQFFRYDPITFEARLEKIYEFERREAEKSDPVLGTGSEGFFNSPARIVERIRQLAPFNQLDGSWLERITKSGPINDVQSFLFEIWSDEIGNGDPAQNHANVYTELMKSAGIYLPPLNSRAYAEHPDMWPGSYSSPAYQGAAALFPETFYPELLGMTLYLEWEAVFLPAMVKLYDYYGYNSLFYRLHVAIDNPVNGHGARARDAVVRYLNDIRATAGEEEMQEHWRRIWDGYLAFKFVGDQDWEYRFANPPTIDERMAAMLVVKRRYAQLNHGTRRFAGNYLNDWFDEPEQFLSALAVSDLIVPGDAASSPIFNTMNQTGVMLKVFTPVEKQLWADWINSLPREPTGGMMSPAGQMRALIRQLRARAMSAPGHDSETLKGSYRDPESGSLVETENTVAWWLSIDQPERLMTALADPQNGWIVPGDTMRSRFVRELMSERRPMARFLAHPIAEIAGKTGRQIVLEWIASGAGLPEERAFSGKLRARLKLMAAIPERTRAPLRDDYSPEVIRRTLGSHRYSSEERRALRRRPLYSGGGAAH